MGQLNHIDNSRLTFKRHSIWLLNGFNKFRIVSQNIIQSFIIIHRLSDHAVVAALQQRGHPLQKADRGVICTATYDMYLRQVKRLISMYVLLLVCTIQD